MPRPSRIQRHANGSCLDPVRTNPVLTMQEGRDFFVPSPDLSEKIELVTLPGAPVGCGNIGSLNDLEYHHSHTDIPYRTAERLPK